QRLATAGQEGDMQIWNVRQRRRLFTLHGHSGAVWDLAYTPDGTRLVSAGSDFLVRVWDAAVSQEAAVLPVPILTEVRALAYGPGGRLLAWADIQGRAGVWDTVLPKEILRIDNPDPKVRNPIVAFAYSPDGRQMAWRRGDGSLKVWDLAGGKEVPLSGAGP